MRRQATTRLSTTALATALMVASALGVLANCGASTGDRGTSPEPAAVGRTLTGRASWYGGKHHGRKTASGERFDKDRLTAAHRSLPFGTRVRVTNLENGRTVVVRINDRGPFGRKQRIIDVSEAAARRLGMLESGVVRVRVEVLEIGDGRRYRGSRAQPPRPMGSAEYPAPRKG